MISRTDTSCVQAFGVGRVPLQLDTLLIQTQRSGHPILEIFNDSHEILNLVFEVGSRSSSVPVRMGAMLHA